MKLINGIQTEAVSSDDRGFMYGDGVFETIKVRDGRPLLLAEHLERLEYGLQKLGLPLIDMSQLQQEIQTALHESRDTSVELVLKIVLTAGTGGRGYSRPQSVRTTRVVALYPLEHWKESEYSDGIHTTFCDTPITCNPHLAGIKHLNRLEQVLARNELAGTAYREGLMQNLQGHIVEGTMSNVFIVARGNVLTPDVSHCGVRGVMRDLVIKLLSNSGTRVISRDLGKDDFLDADECFLTNSIIGVCPVKMLDSHRYHEKSVSKRLMALVQEYEFST